MDQRTVNELADELRLAFEQLDLPAAPPREAVRNDGLGELGLTFDGRDLTIAVTTRADLRPAQAKELALVSDLGVDGALVFADRLSENSRAILKEHGWGWLDRRRGHLRLWCSGLRLDAPIGASITDEKASRVRDPFSHSGISLALWLLFHADESASPRAISRELGVSAGQISNLLTALKAEALVRRDKTPLIPELFWALAEHWQPRRFALSSMPSFEELAGAEEMRTRHWVLSDTRAAMRYGAPVVVGPNYPPDIYLPDQKSLNWLLNRSTVAPEFAQRIASVAVAPTSLVNDVRFWRRDSSEQWPLAHPVVVALDLAIDRNRGREVLEQWVPDQALAINRVW